MTVPGAAPDVAPDVPPGVCAGPGAVPTAKSPPKVGAGTAPWRWTAQNSAFDDGGADETLVGGEASVPSARMNAEWTRFISLDLWLPLIKTLIWGDDKLEFLKGLESKKCQQTPVRSRTRVVE